MNTTDSAAFVAASARLDSATDAAVDNGVPLEEDFHVTNARVAILNLFDRQDMSRRKVLHDAA